MTDPKRLFDFPYYQLATYPQDAALVSKVNGEWIKTSTQEYIDKANAISRGLIHLGVQPNDKVAIISMTNRTEWNICDIGILQTGAQDVPIYPTISEEEYEYVLNHSESKYVFVSCDEVFQKIDKIKQNVPSLKGIYCFETLANCDNWMEVIALGDEHKDLQEEVDKRKEVIGEDDLATLIYTSGTTGRPKGVMLSHKNIASNAKHSKGRLPIEMGKSKALSFLPVCHIYERMLLYMYQYCGVSIHFAESLETISDNLKEVHPEVMTAVPRLLEKVYDKIIAKGTDLTGVKKKLFFWAVELGLKWEPYGQNGWWYETQLKLARKLIFSKWQEALGGNLRAIASGSAALQPRLARVFNAAGCPVMEGYGLTETSPVVSVNDMRNHGFKIGTVGKPLPDTEVKIAEDGEILIKGPQVMQGYYKDPEQTDEVLKNGYFHTGDIGEIDSEGFLKITDRKKSMFKTSGGKYVAPQLIENAMKQSNFIEQILVVGEGEKMPAALIQPNWEFVNDWIDKKNNGISKNPEEAVKDEKLMARFQKEVDKYNERFGKWEKVKTFALTPDTWSIEGGQLTPTMKAKRKVIKEMYKDLYEGLYGR
ncbi:MAG TPA: long-chain fatty acid--CoA ligase [Flavobacteriaceae bacterium]|jgi:long-chain acyl-CoA synthetase|nr:long-chain fatty acid--CoA ligase [Flavobacteriaceae bacterium]MAY52423.1 long-chain fatty acid--CoA ligase [Flavobacteriaceae bacterium]HBR54595.1 long-chain fatty acid--CoA ligase [Flavobacteriaceae bacterium]HIB48310.1 long-chain fatty acid--CoA ligase [Flavobacteriaceae bacterium]HIN97734.1 long-chain fatty acid--CoA ligase [Flavobacteriaceae bacterium]|tara:strand:- start:2690 stop:4468 length:1779 start_codon:yes stop_codon:yes gene_type:complete